MEQMEPGDIAGIVFDRVMDFCTKIYDNTLECIVNHAPEQLSVFMDSYLEDEGKLPRPHGRGFGVSSGLHDAPSSPLRGVYVPPTRTSR